MASARKEDLKAIWEGVTTGWEVWLDDVRSELFEDWNEFGVFEQLFRHLLLCLLWSFFHRLKSLEIRHIFIQGYRLRFRFLLFLLSLPEAYRIEVAF